MSIGLHTQPKMVFKSEHKGALVLAVGAITSQLLGLFRDRLLAGTFGANEMLDVYYAAFRIPDLIYLLAASLVSAAVLVPLLSGERSEDNERKLPSLATAFILSASGVACIGYLAMPFLTPVLVPGFSSELQGEYTMLARILLLSPILMGISSFLGSIHQARERFWPVAFAPAIYNLGIIGGIIFAVPAFGIQGVVFGVIAGAFLHMALQVPLLATSRSIPWPRLSVDLKFVRRVFSLSAIRTLGVSANRILLIAVIAAASVAGAGGVAVLSLALNIQTIPLAVIGLAYAVAAFPKFSRLASDTTRFTEAVGSTLARVMTWSLVATGLVLALHTVLVDFILGAGVWTFADSKQTGLLLAIFAISFFPQAAVHVLSRAFYATGDTKTPLISSVIAALTGGGLILGALWGTEYISLPLLPALAVAYAGGFIINATLLITLFRRRFTGAFRTLPVASTLISGIMGFLAAIAVIAAWGDLAFAGRFLVDGAVIVTAVLAGGIASGAVLIASKNEVMLEVLSILRRGIRKQQ